MREQVSRGIRGILHQGNGKPSENPSYVYMMEEYWPNPDEFDLMRLTADKAKARNKYVSVPFGDGAHMCLGLHFAYMQTKLFMYHLLTSVRGEIADRYARDWQAWTIPKPKDGLKLWLTAL